MDNLQDMAGWLVEISRSTSRRAQQARTMATRRLAPLGCAYRGLCGVAHRWRYVPLFGVLLGAILVLVAPGRGAGDALSDDSMTPTIPMGQAVQVDRGAFTDHSPKVGQIVTFHPPVGETCATVQQPGSACPATASASAAGEGIKRIVAGSGATVAIVDGQLIRNGRPVFESYDQRACVASVICQMPIAVRVPHGTWWVLADNRNAPNDSRTYGPIPTAWITGLVASAITASVRRGGDASETREAASG
jgi:signal peptidase I